MIIPHSWWGATANKTWIAVRFVLFAVGGVLAMLPFALEFMERIFRVGNLASII
jgi:hypothetical protein